MDWMQRIHNWYEINCTRFKKTKETSKRRKVLDVAIQGSGILSKQSANEICDIILLLFLRSSPWWWFDNDIVSLTSSRNTSFDSSRHSVDHSSFISSNFKKPQAYIIGSLAAYYGRRKWWYYLQWLNWWISALSLNANASINNSVQYYQYQS